MRHPRRRGCSPARRTRRRGHRMPRPPPARGASCRVRPAPSIVTSRWRARSAGMAAMSASRPSSGVFAARSPIRSRLGGADVGVAAHEAGVDGRHGRTRRGAEIVAQAPAERGEQGERLLRAAVRRERAHQVGVQRLVVRARFAQRREHHDGLAGATGGQQRRAREAPRHDRGRRSRHPRRCSRARCRRGRRPARRATATAPRRRA